MANVLVIGACGQLGSELTIALRELHHVVASDIREPDGNIADGPFELLDAMDKQRLVDIVRKHNINQIYHLAAILSAKGEANPGFAWNLNMTSLSNVMEVMREEKLEKMYWPSSIAVFGPNTPRDNTPQHCAMDPTTVYGISKLAGERWCEYYFKKYDVDVRSLRYPGLIGYKAKPGGGTTDYAVDIFYKAIEEGSYECFLKEDAYLPMMYMEDAIRATIELMEADREEIKIRSSYNLGGISFCPRDIAQAIQSHLPDFKISYNPDFRQQIAETWPNSIDDSAAQKDWGWDHEYDLDKMTATILEELPGFLKQKKN